MWRLPQRLRDRPVQGSHDFSLGQGRAPHGRIDPMGRDQACMLGQDQLRSPGPTEEEGPDHGLTAFTENNKLALSRMSWAAPLRQWPRHAEWSPPGTSRAFDMLDHRRISHPCGCWLTLADGSVQRVQDASRKNQVSPRLPGNAQRYPLSLWLVRCFC